MIDEKKIEHEAICYTTDGYGQSCNSETLELIEESFKSGADWAIQEFLKDLWHPIKEKPQKMSIFLYQTVNKEFGMRMIVEERDWKFVVKYQRATRWLYIDDLLPKEGGNHD